MFNGTDAVTVYYLPNRIGWGSSYWGRPAVLWDVAIQTAANFGVQGGTFHFDITASENFMVVVEACTNLTVDSWTPLQTGTLVDGSLSFSDSHYGNYPVRYYRTAMPSE